MSAMEEMLVSWAGSCGVSHPKESKEHTSDGEEAINYVRFWDTGYARGENRVKRYGPI